MPTIENSKVISRKCIYVRTWKLFYSTLLEVAPVPILEQKNRVIAARILLLFRPLYRCLDSFVMQFSHVRLQQRVLDAKSLSK